MCMYVLKKSKIYNPYYNFMILWVFHDSTHNLNFNYLDDNSSPF